MHRGATLALEAPELEQPSPHQEVPGHEGKPTTPRYQQPHVKQRRQKGEDYFKDYEQRISQYACVSGRFAEDLASQHDHRDDHAGKFYEGNA